MSPIKAFSLGGMFLATKDVLPVGSVLQMVFDTPGGEVRVRASVRQSAPGEGMGIGFVDMASEHRGRLNHFLLRLQEGAVPGKSHSVRSAREPSGAAPQSPWVGFADLGKEAARVIEAARLGNLYGVLGVAAGASTDQIKRRYYELAKSFHPDKHAAEPEFAVILRDVMEVLTLAYRTLKNPASRAGYDQQRARKGALNLRREKTEAQLSAEECLARAMELLRGFNFAASIVWLRRCVDLEPTNGKYHALLARSLSAVPQYRREAAEHFERALALDPSNVTAYRHFAELYVDINLPWRARSLCMKGLEIDPANERLLELLDKLDVLEDRASGKSRHGFPHLFSRKEKN